MLGFDFSLEVWLESLPEYFALAGNDLLNVVEGDSKSLTTVGLISLSSSLVSFPFKFLVVSSSSFDSSKLVCSLGDCLSLRFIGLGSSTYAAI